MEINQKIKFHTTIATKIIEDYAASRQTASRGEGTEQSDIDLLVDLDYSQPIGLEFIQMQIDLEALLRKKVDLISSRGLSKHIAPHINKEKILIYAR